MEVLNILNTIRAQSSQMYQDRIPTATKENLTDIGSTILDYEPLQNEFVGAIVNKIAFTEVSARRFVNPLAPLKSGKLPFGNTWEEVHINPAVDKGAPTRENEVSGLLSTEDTDAVSIYHSRNRQGLYKVSVSYERLQTAFKSIDEMGTFISEVIESMYAGDEIDEFGLMKNVISDGVANDYLVTKELPYDGGAKTCADLVKLIKTLSHDFTEPTKAFNGYNLKKAEEIAAETITGRITWTPKDNQVLLIRSDVDASTDVEVLAKAFNMDKVEFAKRKFVVSSFGDTDTLCVIADERLFKFKDSVYTVKKQPNGYSLVDNYFLHHYQTISLSLFANAVAIKGTAVATTE